MTCVLIHLFVSDIPSLLVGHHLNCKRDFDGSGGEIAHSRTGYDMHFDDDENYKIRDYDMDGIYFVRVAVHEIGHVLGLTHNDKADSIMYPIYQTSAGAELELGTNDRRALQQVGHDSCSYSNPNHNPTITLTSTSGRPQLMFRFAGRRPIGHANA